jgi:hypothetical protein
VNRKERKARKRAKIQELVKEFMGVMEKTLFGIDECTSEQWNKAVDQLEGYVAQKIKMNPQETTVYLEAFKATAEEFRHKLELAGVKMQA